MANALALFEQKTLQLPDHLRHAFGEESNLPDRVTVPSLTYKGKVWTVSDSGDKARIEKADADGDVMPVQTLRTIILDYGKRRGRALYEGGFEDDKPKMPICYSDDGVTASKDVKEGLDGPNGFVTIPKRKCDGCPMAAKGSKVDERGKAVVACSQHRMLAVLPVIPGKGLYPKPLRLKIAVTSDYDKTSEEATAKGWFAYQQFLDFLRAKGVPHTATLLVKMKFDDTVAYPKIFFQPERFLSEAETEFVAPLTKSEEVAGLISAGWTPNGVDGTKVDEAADEDDGEPVIPAPAKAAKPKAAPKAEPKPEPKKAAKPAPVEEEDEEEDLLEERPAPKTKATTTPAPAAEKPKAAKPKAAPAPADDDDDGELIPPTKASPKADKAKPVKQAAPAPAEDEEEEGETTAATSDVDDLLSEWDD